MGEEAAEAANKILKAYQLAHARQDKIEHRNLDVFNRMWDRSDPEFHRHLDQTAIRKDEPWKPDHYPEAVLDMCRDPESDSEWEVEE